MFDLNKPFNNLRGQIICGIYRIVINNKSYVGSSLDIKKRLRQHRRELRRDIHDNKYLQNLYNKYGTATYEILEECSISIKNIDLRKKEQEWINKLNAEINLQDPIIGIGGISNKTVYQYSLNGELIKIWNSCVEAARELNINYGPLHSCANPKCISKSAYGFIWSYEKLDKIKYISNTGSNLDRVPVYLYHLDGSFYKEYSSLSDCAREIAKEINYNLDWKNLRSTIGYALKNPLSRTIRKKYKVSYNKADTFKNSIDTGS